MEIVLSHPVAQSRINQSRLLRTMSGWVLSIATEGDFTVSLGNLFQCSITFTVKELVCVFKWNFPFQSVPITSYSATGYP